MSIFLLLLPSLLGSPTILQDPVELKRLADDQHRLADQALRLENLLLALEERERQEGNDTMANLLQKAGSRIREANGAESLAAALEGAAVDLGGLRSGPALAIQAEAIALLEEVLDLLLETERTRRLEILQGQAQARQEALKGWAREQRALLEKTHALQHQEESEGVTDSEAREGLAEEQAKLNEALSKAAENPKNPVHVEDVLEAASRAEKELEKVEGDLGKAAEAQRQALEKLQSKAGQAGEESKKLEAARKVQDLLQFLAEAEALLARHRAVDSILVKLGDRGRPLPRSARLELRKLAEEEMDIARATADLGLELRESRTGSFSFLVGALEEDHRLLGRRMGPPRFLAGDVQESLSKRILSGWTALIDAVQLEAQRERRKLENSLPGNPSGAQSLVSFAAEIHLLATLEEDIRNSLDSLARRRELLAEAGLPWDEDDTLELDMLMERQGRLRRLFDSLLEELQAETPETEEDL